VREVEPYIFAGRFLDWELQAEVIDSYLERYYLGERGDNEADADDFIIPEIFEKVIINLNLRLSSNESITKFIRFGEKNFLTSSVLHLYTQLYDRKEVRRRILLKLIYSYRMPPAYRCSFPCTIYIVGPRKEKRLREQGATNLISKS
jgi:hypothetical protein